MHTRDDRKNIMGLKNKMCGYEIEHMPNLSFRLMSFVLSIRDFLFPVWKKLDQFNIENGFIIVDFGCGPGSFVEHASKLVGNNGKVYAVDVHPLAIKAIKEKAKSKTLANVAPVLSLGYPVDIDSHIADVIYALDMFHHIKDTRGFLKELHRLLKPDGTLFIESGHQLLDNAKQKIMKSGCWVIIKEERNMFKCSPK
jgi:2-polyprenyl-3-methyl-5-hydroxy-6-metoxy-1,4-benzoquinol methylase